MRKIFTSVVTLVVLTLSSCEDFLEVLPKDQIVSTAVYKDDASAVAAIRGIYAQMMSSQGFAGGGSISVTALAGRAADDFTNMNGSPTPLEFSANAILPNNSSLRSGLWQEPYRYIYAANLVLANLERTTTLTEATSAQLKGEALFVRAFCHFYLTNLFGDVPLITSADYQLNATASRNARESVLTVVVADLLQAKSLIADAYVTTERVRPNKATISAFLARVYLYIGDWTNAELEASAVIQNTMYSLRSDLNTVFRKNSTEAIFQLMPSSAGNNTNEGSIFVLVAAPTAATQVVLNNALVGSFEPGDRRRTNWVGTISSGANTWYYPYKYKIRTGTPVDEYSMVFRLAEQYLIRAEARAQLARLPEAIADLDVIRQRAGLSLLQSTNPGISQANLLLAIERERRVELFSEWGHRWFDLKRTGRVDAVLGSKPGWQSTDALFPIPQADRDNNLNLTQNAGY